jgi:hypothetical protein
LRAARHKSIWEQEVGEVLGEHIGGGGGVRICTSHFHLIFNADRDDVARGYSLEVDLVVGRHHAKGLLDAQMKGAAHALGDVPAEGAQATRQQAPGLRLAFFNHLADLEGGSPQLSQLLLRGVVGRLHSLGLDGRIPQGGPRA